MFCWYTVMFCTVVSACGCFWARLYSAPIGEKSVASDPPKLDPDMSRSSRAYQRDPHLVWGLGAGLTLHRVPKDG